MPVNVPHDPPFRADHVGSLLRPPELIEARRKHEQGTISVAELRAIEDVSIRDVVAMQESVGLRSITDGEFRRASYLSDFFAGVFGPEGMKFVPSKVFFHHNDRGERVPAFEFAVLDKARWNSPIFADGAAFLRSVTDQTIKTTVPSPIYVHFTAGRAGIDPAAYANLDAFWSDIVEVYSKEMQALAQAGCNYLQIDETSIVKLGDPAVRSILEDRGEDVDHVVQEYAEVLNAVLSKAPPGMSVGIHACRGNNRGMWQADTGYEKTADILFRKIRAKFYFLEYDSPRAGSFDALRSIPDDRFVVLGLVTTKSGALEDSDVLEQRINQAARYIDKERLGLSPQCGFASGVLGNELTLDEEMAKLRRVVDVADRVWG